MLNWLFGSSVAPKPGDANRSPKWPAVRKAWLVTHPTCAACGRRDELQVHHIKPFHLYPELELDPSNFITLCEGSSRNDHLTFGHFYLWTKFNPNVVVNVSEFFSGLRASRATTIL